MRIDRAVAERMKKLNEQRGKNPNMLATAAGLPSSTVTSILYGKSRNPGVATLQLICEAYGISLAEFFSSEEFDNLDPVD